MSWSLPAELRRRREGDRGSGRQGRRDGTRHARRRVPGPGLRQGPGFPAEGHRAGGCPRGPRPPRAIPRRGRRGGVLRRAGVSYPAGSWIAPGDEGLTAALDGAAAGARSRVRLGAVGARGEAPCARSAAPRRPPDLVRHAVGRLGPDDLRRGEDPLHARHGRGRQGRESDRRDSTSFSIRNTRRRPRGDRFRDRPEILASPLHEDSRRSRRTAPRRPRPTSREASPGRASETWKSSCGGADSSSRSAAPRRCRSTAASRATSAVRKVKDLETPGSHLRARFTRTGSSARYGYKEIDLDSPREAARLRRPRSDRERIVLHYGTKPDEGPGLRRRRGEGEGEGKRQGKRERRLPAEGPEARRAVPRRERRDQGGKRSRGQARDPRHPDGQGPRRRLRLRPHPPLPARVRPSASSGTRS